MEYLNFYSHERISEHIHIFNEGYSMVHRFTIGVITGNKKVLVIDSGLGMDSGLRNYIEGVVGRERPIICACTHGNIDHVGGAYLFDERYLNSRDYTELSRAFDRERRISDLEAFALHNPEVADYCRQHMTDNEGTVFEDIDEGDVLDLGGVLVEPVRTPGHTPGHLAYLCRQEKVVFTGDAINIDTHLKRLDRKGLFEYRDMLYRFISLAGEEVALYAGHINRPHTIQVARNLARACEEVAMGKTYGDPPGESIFRGKTGNPSVRMHYAGNTCVVYNSDNFKKES